MGNKNSTSSRDLAALAKDTKMDRDEVEELMKTFNKLARKGKITKESIKDAMKKTYGESYDPGFSSLLFNLFDKDGSKEIDAQEFILAVGYLMNRSLEDVVTTSFRCIDLNGDGFISKGELKSVVMTNFKIRKWVNVHKKAIGWDKVQVTPAEMGEISRDTDELFAALDLNKDGQVSREEFLQRANSSPYLKKKLTELLIKDEGLNVLKTLSSRDLKLEK
eukprot:Phypoly_transcript_18193.p1 GENE.Phypoly_transcript_18193~~Phypoly_transcript_18193.p1  ORF type:complete len:220 (+),score=37.72 Phypoly_transcript_18193:115-774(+)